MHHQLCEDFYQYWLSCRPDNALPPMSAFTPQKSEEFSEHGFVLALENGDIIVKHMAAYSTSVLSEALVDRPLKELYLPSMQSMQTALVMPCFTRQIGMVRTSRVWYGHRHKEVEMILLPVSDEDTGTIYIVGVVVAFVDRDARDKISPPESLVERVVRQNFLSFGHKVDFSIIDPHSWAVLDTMGAVVLVDGAPIEHDTRGLAGGAGLVAAKAAHANVLGVAPSGDFSFISRRMGERYNLHLVQTQKEAVEILAGDMIDILVTVENFQDGTGTGLIEEVKKLSRHTACVLMLDRNPSAEDSRIEENDRLIYRLVRPVGEYALRKALDEANKYVSDKRLHEDD